MKSDEHERMAEPMAEPMTWRERAARVRSGAGDLADAPAAVDDALMRGLFDTILRTSFDAVVLCDRISGEYLEVSDSFCRLTGYARAELLGHNSIDLGITQPGGARMVATADVVLGHEGMYENVITRSNGEELIVEFTHSFLQEDYTLVVVRDITARHRREAELHHLARHDALTGVLNRRGFIEAADRLLVDAREDGTGVRLVMLDVDGLKAINDDLGHHFGDQALIAVASALETAYGPGAAVGRLGGDEFVVAVGGTDEVDAAAHHAFEEALAAVSVGPAGARRPVSASTGTARADAGIGTLERMLAAADKDQYVAKRARQAARIMGS